MVVVERGRQLFLSVLLKVGASSLPHPGSPPSSLHQSKKAGTHDGLGFMDGWTKKIVAANATESLLLWCKATTDLLHRIQGCSSSSSASLHLIIPSLGCCVASSV